MNRTEDIRQTIARSKMWDKIFMVVGLLSMSLGLLVLFALMFSLLRQGLPRLSWNFLTSFPDRKAEIAGVLSAWVGSALVMFVTASVAIPLGIGAGIYLEEYGRKNWFSDLIEINVTNLAGIPSIIYGLLGLGIFKYALGFGESVLTAGLTLSLLVLPVVIVTTREGIRAVPSTIREAAYALGATKWQVTKDHVLPYATGTILTGIIVALARAIGETAPLITIGALTFIAYLPNAPIQGKFPFISFEWLWSGFTVLPIQMFDWISRPQEDFHVNAAAAGIVILAMTLTMNAIAIYLRYRLRKNITW
jgi:phosphate transport system permease protein